MTTENDEINHTTNDEHPSLLDAMHGLTTTASTFGVAFGMWAVGK